MMKKIFFIFIAFFVWNSSFAVVLPEEFTANKLERGYWNILANGGQLVGQTDARFGPVGMLVEGNDSALCGAVSASIGLASFRKTLGIDVSAQQIVTELIQLRAEALAKVELDIAQGLFTNIDLNSVIGVYSQKVIPNKTASFDAKDLLFDLEITLGDLQRRYENEFLVLKLALHTTEGTANHFVTVVAMKSDMSEIIVADPYEPTKPLRVRVVPVTEAGSIIFSLIFEKPFHNSQSVTVEGVSRVHF